LHRSEISKTSLRIYTFLLESGRPHGVREIARGLNLPVSTVYYHLKRLEELGLLVQEAGGYRVARTIDLEDFYTIGRRVLPRLLIFSMFFLGVLVGELAITILTGGLNADRMLVMLVSAIAFLLFFVEGRKAKQRLLGGKMSKKGIDRTAPPSVQPAALHLDFAFRAPVHLTSTRKST